MNTVNQKHYRGCNRICVDSNEYYVYDIYGNIMETYYKGDKSNDAKTGVVTIASNAP